ncbi:MAG: phosphosulfolactate synthase [Jhaorihella sp.]
MSEPFAFVPVTPDRSRQKPRDTGLTMIIDDGVPLGAQRDLLNTGAAFVDIAKIKTGSARLYDEAALMAKIALYREHGLEVFPGGQFLEYVLHMIGPKAAARYWDEARRLGFGAVEVSDNVVAVDDELRRDLITGARSAGLRVFAEIGSKEDETAIETLIAQGRQSLDAGADLLLVEAAELIHGGRMRRDLFDALVASFDPARLLFELPGPWIEGTCHHRIESLAKMLVAENGPDVNLGNVAPDRIIDLEGIRCGLGVAGPPTILASEKQ